MKIFFKLCYHPTKDILTESWATFGAEKCGRMEFTNILNMLYPPPELTPVQREMIHASQLGYIDHKYEEFPSETDRKMFSDLPPEILEVLVLLPHDQEWIFSPKICKC